MKYTNLTIKVSVPVGSGALVGDLNKSRYSFENTRNTMSSLFAGDFKGRGGSIYYTVGEVDVDTVGGALFESSAVVSATFTAAPANDGTVVIGTQTLTWKTAAPANENEVSSSTATGSAGNLANAINDHSVLGNVFVASATGATCSIFYKPVDAVGALLTVTSSGAGVTLGSPTGTGSPSFSFVVSGSNFEQSTFSPVSLKKGV